MAGVVGVAGCEFRSIRSELASVGKRILSSKQKFETGCAVKDVNLTPMSRRGWGIGGVLLEGGCHGEGRREGGRGWSQIWRDLPWQIIVVFLVCLRIPSRCQAPSSSVAPERNLSTPLIPLSLRYNYKIQFKFTFILTHYR